MIALNFLAFLLSIPMLWAGIWLKDKGTSECYRFLDVPFLFLCVFFMLVSLAVLICACFRVIWALWVCLLVMFVFLFVLFCFTMFAFLVSYTSADKVVSQRGYEEYRLGNYSNWLQKRVTDTKNWNKIQSCLVDAKVCSKFNDKFFNDTATACYKEHLSFVQSGCCKPPDECGFTCSKPNVWEKTATNSTNPDCNAWVNDPSVLCFNCNAYKAGVLQNIKTDWIKVATINIIILGFVSSLYLAVIGRIS